MPSYNKAKLLNMLEQRHAASLSMRDLSERFRDASSEKEVARSKIYEETRGRRLPDGFLARLLGLPADEALALTSEEIDTFSEVIGGEERHFRTGIGFATYRRFINARDKAARLSDALESARTILEERFGIVPNLVDAVRSWGFADPELEI
jgi:hypothetical protein